MECNTTASGSMMVASRALMPGGIASRLILQREQL
jgi:hypothetical protein